MLAECSQIPKAKIWKRTIPYSWSYPTHEAGLVLTLTDPQGLPQEGIFCGDNWRELLGLVPI